MIGMMSLQKTKLTNIGEGEFVVPQTTTSIHVLCVGQNGFQYMQNLTVEPGSVITYYIEGPMGDNFTYFGPYLCAHGHDEEVVRVLGEEDTSYHGQGHIILYHD